MASNATIGGKIVLDGEKEYRAALKNITADQKELRSEMSLSQATFKDQQNSLDALEQKYEILTKQIDKQTEKIEVYQHAVTAWSQKQKSAADKVEELRTALTAAEKEMASMKESSEDNSDAIKAQEQVIQELNNKLSLAEQSYSKATQKTTSYQTALNNAQAELVGMEKELSQTGRYLDEAKSSTDNCAQSIDAYGNSAGVAAQKTSVFGDVLKANLLSDVVRTGLKRLADGIEKVADAAIDTGSSFEASMSQVAATMGMTTQEIHDGSEAYTMLADAAKDAGKTTMFSATEAGEALNYLALAGYDAQKSVATLPKTLDLAAAGGLNLAYAADLITDSASALNLQTDKLDIYIDQMARTSQKSNTSIAQLGEATLVCAGTVSLAKQKLETMNTELGILANNGIKGAEGGTHLRNIILSLSAPTDTAKKAIEQLGLQISDSKGNMRDLNDILIDLNAAMDGMSSTDRTQMINQIFNKTDIASVNALLKGTGEEFDNLYHEISSSSGAAKEMANTLNDNLKGKVTILKSALEGLGISAYEIFDDTMKASVESATNAVGRLQKSIDSGSMGVSLNRLSRSMAEFADGALETGEDVLPLLIDGLSWLLDNADIVTAGIAGIAAANLQMRVVSPAIEAVTGAWRLYKASNESATVSQWLLNAAMSANPAGMLLTTLTALTAAVAAYVVINWDNLSATDEVTKATQEQVEAAKRLNEEMSASSSNRMAERASLEAEAVNCRKLSAELKELQSKTTLTSAEQARMQMIVDELNQAMPNLNLQIDEQTNLLNMSTDALEGNVEAMMALARVEAAREDLTKIAREQYQAEKQLLSLNEQLEKQTKAVAKAEEDLADVIESVNLQNTNAANIARNVSQSNEAQLNALKVAREAQEELEEQIRATEKSLESLGSEYERTMDYISENEALTSATEDVEALGNAADNASDSVEEMAQVAQEALEEMYDSVYDLVTSQIDLFAEFNGAAKLSTDELLNNMQTQVEGVRQWSENLETLAERGISQGLLQHLADMGPQGAGYVATFVNMTEEELQRANELYEDALSLPDDTAEAIVSSYTLAGEMAALGYKGGIEENAEAIATAGEAMAADTLDRTEGVLNKETGENIGKNFVTGLQKGISDSQPKVVDISHIVASAILVTFQTDLDSSNFEEIGNQICAGLEQGIRNGQGGVVQAVQDICTAAVAAATIKLDIHSPSKKFQYLGEMSGEGYKEGWLESMSDVDAIIASAMPDTLLNPKPVTAANRNNWSDSAGWSSGDRYDINQEINIYAATDDPIEAARKFRQAQREAAEEW